MSRVTAINQFYVAELTDLPNAEVGFGTPIDQIDSVSVPRFTTPAQRDARIVAPVAGMHCYCTSTDEDYIYRGTSWVGVGPRYRNVPAAGYGNIDTADFFETALAWPFEANSVYIGEINLQFFSTDPANNVVEIKITGPATSTVYGESVTRKWDSHRTDGGDSLNQISANGDLKHNAVAAVGNDAPPFWMKFRVITGVTAGALTFTMNKNVAYASALSWRGYSTCQKVG